MTACVTTSASTAAPALNKSTISLTGPFGDWRDELLSNGYVVLKGVIPLERAQYYQQKALSWLQSFSTSLDYANPSTWTENNLPADTRNNLFNKYCVSHEKFMWEARMEPKVLEAFSKIWGTEELLVSFDALNITLPDKTKPVQKPWPHVDQSPFRRGLHCVQGIINLSPAGPDDGSLIVVPKSNTVTESYFDTQTDLATWTKKDFRLFDEVEMEWFKTQHGVKPIKVLAEPGDLILWDSRTIHWGGEPTSKSDTIRTVIYVSYSPANLASQESLQEKQRAFMSYRATTHWAHDNIVLRDPVVYLPDGTVDSRNRTAPLEEASHTDQLLCLAGMKPYP
ncbi:hypothetical protein N7462_009055 [Penicillium macrosclerotiorum]|uniref:uncharacterized protein n=1 Tax=Penicillium macrosclerotiorum TaxID=303699 RepID=UPI0025492F1F|nr:uncharacterized protein N7462_009055 [Penicillium macrosclerotiorum]KAJ5676158.1 hypothetical protein N7462_009055 [Penicillium macrosclerotiorum]